MRFTDLDQFTGYAMSACDGADKEAVQSILMVDDDEDGMACMAINEPTHDHPTSVHLVDQLCAGRHDFAALASQVRWAPDDDTDFADSWLLVAVQRDRTAFFAVGRPERWYELSPTDVPWFAASTAGSLRKVLDGESLGPIKSASDGDRALFDIVGRGPAPPHDEHGRI